MQHKNGSIPCKIVEMDSQLKEQIEKGTKIAFQRYRERHPSLAHHLETNHSKVISSTIKSIENDPEAIAAIRSAQTEKVIQEVIEVAINYIPKIVSIL